MPDRRAFLLAAAALAGCAAAPAPTLGPAGPVLWPSPPELPRFRYEAALRSARSLAETTDAGRLRRALTGDEEQASFGKPFAVAARGGRVYVGDTEGRRVFVFDIPRRRTFAFGLRREGELKKPAGIAVDAQGFVHVVDATAKRLVVYDAFGLYRREVDGTRDWTRPTGAAVRADGARVAVVDTGGVESDAHAVFEYDGEGRLLRRLGGRGERDGEFNLPVDAGYAPDGSLWVLDAGNFRVQAFDADGRFLRAFGSAGNGFGQFGRPRGLAVGADGLLYVSDASFCNVQVFAPDGTLLLAIGTRGEEDAPGRYRLPAGLAVDETGRLYVVDQYFHKVEVIRRLGDAEAERLRAGA